jgi:hypothetical protein
MPEKTIKRRLTEAGARELADDDGPIFSTVAKLVDALAARRPSFARSRAEGRSLAPRARSAPRDQVRGGAMSEP